MPGLSPWGGTLRAGEFLRGRWGRSPSDGSSEAPIPPLAGPLLPALCRAALEETPCPLAPAHTPPAHSRSRGSHHLAGGRSGRGLLGLHQATAATSGNHGEEAPAASAGPGAQAGWWRPPLPPSPSPQNPGLIWPRPPAPRSVPWTHVSRGHPHPSQLRPLQPELLRLEHREDARGGGPGVAHSARAPVDSWRSSQVRAHGWRAKPGGAPCTEATVWQVLGEL